MMSLAQIVSEQTRRTAAVALAAVCLAAGCGDARLIDDSAAAAAPTEVDDATFGDGSTTPIAPAAPLVPDLPPLPSPPDLDELLAEERFVALAVALERTGLDVVIDGLDDFVLLAPIGSAFETAGTDVGIQYATLMTDQRVLDAVIRYHIVADPSTNETWRTLNGATPQVDGSNPRTVDRVDGVEVLEGISVRNGTVLVIPQLLLPAAQPSGSALHGDD